MVSTAHAISGRSNTTLGILCNTLLEKISFALEGNKLHPVEGILGPVDLFVAQSDSEPIGTELNVLRHKAGIHSNKRDGQGVANKLFLRNDSVVYDFVHRRFRELEFKHRIQEASKIAVQTLVS